MNRAKFQKSLTSLVGWRERAFILSLAERAAPNVALYLEGIQFQPYDHEQFPQGVFSLVDNVWQSLIIKPNEEEIIALLDVVAESLPEEVDEDHYGILPARDMFAILEMALLGGVNEEKRRALDASQRSLETVTQFLEFSEGDGLSENALIKLFDRHPLIEREFSFQQELSDMLRAANTPSKDMVKTVRGLAADEGVSNIGVVLD